MQMGSAAWRQIQMAGKWGGFGLATMQRKAEILHIAAMTRAIPIVKRKMTESHQPQQGMEARIESTTNAMRNFWRMTGCAVTAGGWLQEDIEEEPNHEEALQALEVGVTAKLLGKMSNCLDKKEADQLYAEANTCEDKCRLMDIRNEVGARYLTDPNHAEQMRDEKWRIVARFRLGEKIIPRGLTCRLAYADPARGTCDQMLDENGNHALGCRVSACRTRRHDGLADLEQERAKAAGYASWREVDIPKWKRWKDGKCREQSWICTIASTQQCQKASAI